MHRRCSANVASQNCVFLLRSFCVYLKNLPYSFHSSLIVAYWRNDQKPICKYCTSQWLRYGCEWMRQTIDPYILHLCIKFFFVVSAKFIGITDTDTMFRRNIGKCVLCISSSLCIMSWTTDARGTEKVCKVESKWRQKDTIAMISRFCC